MSIKKILPGVGSESLDSYDDEIIDEASTILQYQGEDVTQEALRKQAAYLKEIKAKNEGELKVGFIQDAEEATIEDQRLVAPETLKRESPWGEMGYFTRNGDYVRILTITQLPEYIVPGVLENLYTTHAEVRISQHITPRGSSSTLRKLKRKFTRLSARIARKKQKEKHDTQEEEKDKNLVENLIWGIISGETRLFDAAIYIEVVADSKEELNQVTENILTELSEKEIRATACEKEQIEAQQALSPAGKDPLKGSRQLVQETVASTFFPFIAPELHNPDGLLYGFDRQGKPIFFEPFSLSSYIEIVAGKQGSGKSFSKMWEILQRYYKDPDYTCWAIDPKSNFTRLAEEIGGEVIKVGGDTILNPLEISPTAVEHIDDPYKHKIRSEMAMYRTHFGDNLTSNHEGVLLRVLNLAKHKYGITKEPSTHDKTSPIIDDHIELLGYLAEGKLPFTDGCVSLHPDAKENHETVSELIQEIESRFSEQDVEYARDLYNGMESFTEGNPNGNLNGRTNVDLDSAFTVFDMSMFADSHQAPLMMHVLIDLIYQECTHTKERDELVIDEVHYLLNNRPVLEFFNIFARHHRHSKTRLSLISQTMSEFLVDKSDDDLRTEIYKTADMKRIFYHKNISDEAVDHHEFTSAQQNYIKTARQGENADSSQCILELTNIGKIPVEVEVPDADLYIVDEDKNAFDYYIDQGILHPKDIEYLYNNGKLNQYIEDIPPEVIQRANIDPDAKQRYLQQMAK